jgi:tRNA A37 N6-isopentenylltransferase MiaA
MHKTYRASVRLTLPIVVGGETLYCEFSDEKHSFNTMDEEVQDYIENTPMFKRGEIKIFKTEEVIENSEEGGELDQNDVIEYPNVNDYQEAADILRKDPYRIHHTKTKTPEDILEQAKLLNVSFPNLQ